MKERKTMSRLLDDLEFNLMNSLVLPFIARFRVGQVDP